MRNETAKRRAQPEVAFREVAGVVLLEGGDYVVGDRALRELKAFDSVGSTIATAGTEQGIADGLLLLARIHGDSVAAYDALRGELRYFDRRLAGSMAMRIPPGVMGFPMQVRAVLDDGEAVAINSPSSIGGATVPYGADSGYLWIVGRQGDPRQTTIRIPIWPSRIEHLQGRPVFLRPIWGPSTMIVARGDEIFIAGGRRPEVVVYDSKGNRQNPVRWTADSLSAGQYTRHMELEHVLLGHPESMRDTIRSILRSWAPNLRPLVFDRLMVDAVGRLWVRHPPKPTSDSVTWSVKTRSGDRIADICMPLNWRPMSADLEHVIGVAQGAASSTIERLALVYTASR